MALQLQKARRSKAYLKLGLAAPSGGGKTLGALIIGYGMMKEKYPNETDAFRWGKIAIIDTENGSGELYVNKDMGAYRIGEYNAITLNPPYEAQHYIDAIGMCEEAGMEVVVIDSTTHLWSGQGGLLEQQANVAKRTGNSYTAWRDITPMHTKFVDKLLQSSTHIICTMRSKQEYVQEKNDAGKTVVRKVGMEPEQRKGMEYEFTAFYDISEDHSAFGSKDRTSIYDQKTFTITPDVGQKLMGYLASGVDVSAPRETLSVSKTVPELQKEAFDLCVEAGGSGNESLKSLLEKYPSPNPNRIDDVDILNKLISDVKALTK